MKKRIKKFFGKGIEKIRGVGWKWETFTSTKGFPISDNLLDWVVGQDKALKECYLCLDEWVHKLKWMEKEQWFKTWDDKDAEKPSAKKFLPAGPYLLLLGDAGTGKSLIGRALASHLTELYKKHKIKLRDVLCWQNELIPSEPKISMHSAGKGKKITQIEKLKAQKKKRLKNWFVKGLIATMLTVGGLFMTAGIYWMVDSYFTWLANPMTMSGRLQTVWNHNLFGYLIEKFVGIGGVTFLPAGMMMIFLVLIMFLGRMGMMGGGKGISGSEMTEAPKMIVDNSQKVAPFIDATGHGSAQLFGSIAWDPLQTGGLGTPEHQRTTAGDAHRAFMGVLYIDEIKNLKPEEAITLLTVLEDGQLPITLRSRWHSGGTSAMAVSTEPVPCFPKGTIILGLGDYRPIEEIKIGDILNRSKITNTFQRYYEGDLIKIKPMYLEAVEITPEHLVKVGKRNARKRRCEVVGWKKAEELTEKDYVIIPKYSLRYGQIDVDSSLAKLGGWYLAEGSPHHGRQIRFTLNPSEGKYADEIIELLGKLGYKGKNKGIHQHGLLVVCNSKGLTELLVGLFGHGAKNKHLPSSFLYWTKENIEGLLSTLVKGDGTVGKQTILKMASLRLLRQIQIVRLLRLGKPSSLTFVKISPSVIRGRQLKGGIYPRLSWQTNDNYQCYEDKENWYFKISKLLRRKYKGLVFNLETEDNTYDVPFMVHNCMTFLVAAGNFDSINQIHPALMDRIYGYGKVVRMNNEMENTVENRRKYVQFISQEIKRFRMPPFSRQACIEVISEGRRRSGFRDKLTTKFRPMISIIKTAGTLALNEGKEIVEEKHVKEAVSTHCKTIQKQLLEHMIEQRGLFLEIEPRGSKLGQVYGLAVVRDQYSGEMTGSVLTVKGYLEKKDKRKMGKAKGFYEVTGVAKGDKERFIKDSIRKVRSVILQKYGVDVAQQYFTHIDFAQSHGVDGPSAGVTMALLLCSLIEGKPIRQDVAVTGEINVGVADEIKITAIGGAHHKILAAQAWGFKKVIIPAKNLKYSINPKDYEIEVVGCKTLDDYLEHILVK